MSTPLDPVGAIVASTIFVLHSKPGVTSMPCWPRGSLVARRPCCQALELDPGYWPARESLENIKNLAVDRWHFRMLNHSARNEAYSRAIRRAVAAAADRPGDPSVRATSPSARGRQAASPDRTWTVSPVPEVTRVSPDVCGCLRTLVVSCRR